MTSMLTGLTTTIPETATRRRPGEIPTHRRIFDDPEAEPSLVSSPKACGVKAGTPATTSGQAASPSTGGEQK
jgi:hypothetical protein